MSTEDARNERQDQDGEEEQFSGRTHLSGLNYDLKQNFRQFQLKAESSGCLMFFISLIHSYHSKIFTIVLAIISMN